MNVDKLVPEFEQLMSAVELLIEGKSANLALSVGVSLVLNYIMLNVPDGNKAEMEAIVDEVAGLIKDACGVKVEKPAAVH